MSLSILLGASQPWLLGAVACTVTLLIVALLMLRRGQLRKQAQPEVEKVSTPPQVDPPSEEVKEEEFSTDSESENRKPVHHLLATMDVKAHAHVQL
ncbi:hypothetical protein OS493_030173 [Desmophyllum pertusum]|uniref:Uncharacterized protein n=1 Tax=Desmophyllum pertusum TaxID=174260 RepID=A0A9W9YXW3_9CNID|nr:hypothetical protein OS493_030173 [Desmophyllum pertusum]